MPVFLIDRLQNLLDRNWRAARRLSAASGTRGRFLCRGRIQLRIGDGATVDPPSTPTYIGIPVFGPGSILDRATVVSLGAGSTLSLQGAVLGRGIVINIGPGSRLSMGEKSYLSDGSTIAAGSIGGVSIGRGCAISFGVTIIDDDGHGFGPPPYSAPIVIEDRVWIGCNATILKGVTIGKGSVVAAGALVTKSCPPGSLIAGVPAKVIREGVEWTDAATLQSGQTW